MSLAPIAALLSGRPPGQRMIWKVAAVLVGSWLLAASSWASIPMHPVPMTLQTFAVFVIAGLCGAQLSLAMVIVWFVQAALGLPLLADGQGGIEPFGGPTAGYLGGFLLTAGVVGRLAENPMMRGWLAMTLLFMAGHALILGLGWARLSLLMPPVEAWEAGVAPFLAGAAAKSVLAMAAVKGCEAVHASAQAPAGKER